MHNSYENEEVSHIGDIYSSVGGHINENDSTISTPTYDYSFPKSDLQSDDGFQEMVK